MLFEKNLIKDNATKDKSPLSLALQPEPKRLADTTSRELPPVNAEEREYARIKLEDLQRNGLISDHIITRVEVLTGCPMVDVLARFGNESLQMDGVVALLTAHKKPSVIPMEPAKPKKIYENDIYQCPADIENMSFAVQPENLQRQAGMRWFYGINAIFTEHFVANIIATEYHRRSGIAVPPTEQSQQRKKLLEQLPNQLLPLPELSTAEDVLQSPLYADPVFHQLVETMLADSLFPDRLIFVTRCDDGKSSKETVIDKGILRARMAVYRRVLAGEAVTSRNLSTSTRIEQRHRVQLTPTDSGGWISDKHPDPQAADQLKIALQTLGKTIQASYETAFNESQKLVDEQIRSVQETLAKAKAYREKIRLCRDGGDPAFNDKIKNILINIVNITMSPHTLVQKSRKGGPSVIGQINVLTDHPNGLYDLYNRHCKLFYDSSTSPDAGYGNAVLGQEIGAFIEDQLAMSANYDQMTQAWLRKMKAACVTAHWSQL